MQRKKTSDSMKEGALPKVSPSQGRLQCCFRGPRAVSPPPVCRQTLSQPVRSHSPSCAAACASPIFCTCSQSTATSLSHWSTKQCTKTWDQLTLFNCLTEIFVFLSLLNLYHDSQNTLLAYLSFPVLNCSLTCRLFNTCFNLF